MKQPTHKLLYKFTSLSPATANNLELAYLFVKILKPGELSLPDLLNKN